MFIHKRISTETAANQMPKDTNQHNIRVGTPHWSAVCAAEAGGRPLEMERAQKMDVNEQILSEKTLNHILSDTIEAVEGSKAQIFDIYEGARAETENIRSDIDRIKEAVREIIVKVDLLEAEEREARKKLVQVSSNFKRYTEEDIKICYENAKNIQIRLAVMREQELNLRNQRDDLELRMKQLQGTAKKAEQLVTQVGVVLGYLSAQVGQAMTQLEATKQEKSFGAQIIRAQEAERLRVSREIHDGPAQIMANAIYRTSICERLVDTDKEQAKTELQELREQVRSCLGEIRKIIFDLRPMTLDDLGLVAAIHHFLEKFRNRFGIRVHVKVIGEEYRINRHVEISLFRVVQEALNNVQKHTQEKEASVAVEYGEKYISLFIEDSGKGFAPQSIKSEEEKSECYGLIGMEERMKLLDGQFLLKSAPGQGTKIRVIVPVAAYREREEPEKGRKS